MYAQIALIVPIEFNKYYYHWRHKCTTVRNKLGGGTNSSHLASGGIENVNMRFCDFIANVFTMHQDIVNQKTALQTAMSSHIMT